MEETEPTPAIVILTRNAVGAADWRAILAAYAAQSLQPVRRIIFDSASNDATCAIAREYDWEIRPVRPEEFNHGRTRQVAVDLLAASGIGTVIFATQDVRPATPETLALLAANRRRSGAGVAYARQCPPLEHGLDALMRRHHYPEHSIVKSRADIPALGLRTAFCSNALAIWEIAALQRNGGFPVTDFGEDMLAAARMILAGEAVSYCAESRCIHGHSDSFSTLFARGRAIGRLHREHPWLIGSFGRAEDGVLRALGYTNLLRYFPALAVKYAGFRRGLHFN